MQPSQQIQRRFDRQDHPANIQFSRYNTNHYHQGRLKNISEGGLYFESQTALRPGETIFIRIIPLSAHPSPAAGSVKIQGLRASTLGEVKWCRELSESKIYRYGVGIQYHAPVY
jgi:hypothetical protein